MLKQMTRLPPPLTVVLMSRSLAVVLRLPPHPHERPLQPERLSVPFRLPCTRRQVRLPDSLMTRRLLPTEMEQVVS